MLKSEMDRRELMLRNLDMASDGELSSFDRFDLELIKKLVLEKIQLTQFGEGGYPIPNAILKMAVDVYDRWIKTLNRRYENQ